MDLIITSTRHAVGGKKNNFSFNFMKMVLGLRKLDLSSKLPFDLMNGFLKLVTNL